MHGYPSRARVGRGGDGEGYWSIWTGAELKTLINAEKVEWGATDRPTDGQSGV